MIVEFSVLICAIVTWYSRIRYDRPGVKRDLTWILFMWYALTPWSDRRWVWKCWAFNLWSWSFVYLKHQRLKREQAASTIEARMVERQVQHGFYRGKIDYNDVSSPMKPVIFPCRTSHTRLFPKKHSFSYSYLFVGIPVGWRGYVSTVLSADLKTLPWSQGSPRNGWFNVDSTDYLARGENLHGLQGKLDDYLESQNEIIEDYPFAYLVTAPRFLGYSFNPVSFWYLYSQEKELKAMILEVNNTFDEKRMYFLKDTDPEDLTPEVGEFSIQDPLTNINEKSEKPPPNNKIPTKFTSSWAKDFHVSPFNSRKGGYSLTATDPFTNHLRNGNLKASCGKVNNTITLSSSKNHPKLIARVFSTSDSIDPYSLGQWQIMKLILSWWWVGFVTFPRIVREAGKLFFRRKLHVWYRPEVLKDSIGRTETEDEKAIANLFREHLATLIASSNLPTPVHFTSNITTLPPSETFHPRSLSPDQHPTPLTIKPTTPLFYALIARHGIQKETITNTDPQTSVLHTSDPDLLVQLLYQPSTISKSSNIESAPRLSALPWNVISHLRKHHTPSMPSITPLDLYAQTLQNIDKSKVNAYRRATLKLLLSDTLTFGVPGLLDAVLFVVRMWLCWVCMQCLEQVVGMQKGLDQADFLKAGTVVLGCLGLPLWVGLGALL